MNLSKKVEGSYSSIKLYAPAPGAPVPLKKVAPGILCAQMDEMKQTKLTMTVLEKSGKDCIVGYVDFNNADSDTSTFVRRTSVWTEGLLLRTRC